MPRFKVEYKETRTWIVEVEAEDADEAEELASNGSGDPISDQFDSFELISVSRS